LTYEEGKERMEAVVNRYKERYPSFIRCLEEDKEALLNVLKLPYRHRRSVRSTNLVERLFLEERRRTKIIPQFLTEKSCLKLVFSVLYRSSYRWNRVGMNEYEIREIKRLRERLGLVEEEEKVIKARG